MSAIYVIGDSISIQYGPFLERSLQGHVDYSRKAGEEEALLNLDNPRGANGGDSSMVLSFLEGMAEQADNEACRADLLLLNCGLHDIKANPDTRETVISLEEYQENLQSIIQLVQQMGPQLVWMRTTPSVDAVHNKPGRQGFHRFASDVKNFNAAADKVMAAHNIPSIDLFGYTLSLDRGDKLFRDHVHFPQDVQELQGSFIAGWVLSYLSKR